jgi:hypothetical protein
MTRKTTITIETSSIVVIRAGGLMDGWCSGCGTQVEMIPMDDLGAVTNLKVPMIEQWLNSGELHRFEGRDGSSAICLNSLVAHLAGGKSAERRLAWAYKETK